jgi:predicted nuclease of predicted toxin-antitoxin system
MALKFFADHCVPTSVIHGLQEAGHTVYCLRDHLAVASSDEVVIARAQQVNALLVSLNGDFSDIVRYPPAHYKGILALQVRNHPEIIPPMMTLLRGYLSQHSDPSHYHGKLFLVEVHRIRIHQ